MPGHLVAWKCFTPVKNPKNSVLIKAYADWARKNKLPNLAQLA